MHRGSSRSQSRSRGEKSKRDMIIVPPADTSNGAGFPALPQRTLAARTNAPAPMDNPRIHSVLVHFVDLGSPEPHVEARRYLIRPAKPLSAVVNNLRDDCPVVAREAFHAYATRLFTSTARQLLTIQAEGLLDHATVTSNTSFGCTEGRWISASLARLCPYTVKVINTRPGRQNSCIEITAKIEYNGKRYKAESGTRAEALNRLTQAYKHHRDVTTAEQGSPAVLLAHQINGLRPDLEKPVPVKQRLGVREGETAAAVADPAEPSPSLRPYPPPGMVVMGPPTAPVAPVPSMSTGGRASTRGARRPT
jgi:hypothetical protein